MRRMRFAAIACAIAVGSVADGGVAHAQPAPRAGAAPRAVTLAGLLRYAERHAPRMIVARAEAARWRTDAAAAEAPVPSDPEVQVAVGPRQQGQASDVDVSVQLRQSLEIAGEPALRGEVAGRARARHAAELEVVRFELHHALHSTFHRALIARERAQVAARVVELSRRLVEVARRRVQAGEDSPLEAQLAELELMRAEQLLSRAEQGYLDARLALAELSGLPADPPPVPAGRLEPPRRAPPLATIEAIAREHGPRLAALRAAAIEARARAELAHRDGWPQPTVGLSYQVEGAGLGGQPREHIVQGIVAIPLPLWHRNPTGRAESEVELDVARARAEVEDRLLAVRVRRYAAAVDAASERAERYLAEVVPAFEARLEQLARAYELGEIDLLQVAATRALLLTGRLEALDAYQEYVDAVTALEDAVGADVWPDRHHAERTR